MSDRVVRHLEVLGVGRFADEWPADGDRARKQKSESVVHGGVQMLSGVIKGFKIARIIMAGRSRAAIFAIETQTQLRAGSYQINVPHALVRGYRSQTDLFLHGCHLAASTALNHMLKDF